MQTRGWITIAENLPLNGTKRHDCPECGLGTNTHAAMITHDLKSYRIFCFACEYSDYWGKGTQTLAQLRAINEANELASKPITELKLPEDFTHDIPIEGRLWLYTCGISESVWKQYRIGYSESYKRVILPVYDNKDNLIWFQCRAIHGGQKPKYVQPSRDKSGVLFTGRVHTTGDTVVITEDMVSAIRVGKHTSSTSILGTKINDGQAAHLAKYRRCITWLDSDRAGRRGAYKIRKHLGLYTDVGNIVTKRDPKCLSDAEIREELSKV